jgi:hypothetical protein
MTVVASCVGLKSSSNSTAKSTWLMFCISDVRTSARAYKLEKGDHLVRGSAGREDITQIIAQLRQRKIFLSQMKLVVERICVAVLGLGRFYHLFHACIFDHLSGSISTVDNISTVD